MAEAAIVAAIERELIRRRAWWINVHGSVVGRNGLPDIIAIHLGHALAIEVKQPRGRVSKLQAWELERIACAGGTAIVARSVQDVRTALDEIERDDHSGGSADA